METTIHSGSLRFSAHGSEIASSTLRFGEPIAHGRHGAAYHGECQGRAVCLKAFKPVVFDCVRNPAREELNSLEKARSELGEIASHLQVGLGWANHRYHGPILISELVLNYDGTVSRNLAQESSVSREFVASLRSILECFIEKERLFNPVAPNILVQRTAPDESSPVLIDFANYERYLHYPLMLFQHSFAPGSKVKRIEAWVNQTLTLCEAKIGAS
ncbi:MAG: hypothetical protein J5J00_04960 [Deltaproteobacteria bacterium]|nr:hypothetical protein [Deltaproteobacteria bacterium]